MAAADDGERSIRVITLLRLIAAAEQPLTANEISVRSGMPKATVYRLCEQLVETGYIRRQISGRGFVASTNLLEFAHDVLAGKSAYTARHAVLERVARQTGETCNLVVPNGSGMIYWDRVETEWPLRLQLPIGSTVPFHATASGKMYLATLQTAQRKRILRDIDLTPHTERTITSEETLEQQLQEIARQGYSVDMEEFIVGMTAVAVPLMARSNRCLGSLAVHAPTSRMSVALARQHVPLLKEAASRLCEDIEDNRTAASS